MADFDLMPATPSKETLLQFLSDRRPYTIRDAAHIIGWPEPLLLLDLQSEGALVADSNDAGEELLVSWDAIALRFLKAWSFDWLFRTLGPEDSHLMPEGLQIVPVTWYLPRYIILAMETQAKLRVAGGEEVHTDRAEDLVGELLHQMIDPATVDALRSNEVFMTAYHFPDEPEGAE